jgi:hypothetical protein
MPLIILSPGVSCLLLHTVLRCLHIPSSWRIRRRFPLWALVRYAHGRQVYYLPDALNPEVPSDPTSFLNGKI